MRRHSLLSERHVRRALPLACCFLPLALCVLLPPATAQAPPEIEQIGLLGPGTFVPGDRPVDAIADPGRDRFYVLDGGLDSPLFAAPGCVSFLTSDGQFVDNVRVPDSPVAFVQAQLSGRLYIAHKKAESFSVLDPDTRQVLATVALGAGVQPVDIEQDVVDGKQFVYVLASKRLHVWDEAQGRIVGTLATHDTPRKIVVNHASDTLYVLDANPAGSTVDVVRKNASFISSDVGVNQVNLVVDETRGKAYVLAKASVTNFQITVIDEAGTPPVKKVLEQGVDGTDLVLDPVGRHLMLLAEGALLHFDADDLEAAPTVVPLIVEPEGALRTRTGLWDPDTGRLWGGFTFPTTRSAGWLSYEPASGAMRGGALRSTSLNFDVLALDPVHHRVGLVHPDDDSVTFLDTQSRSVLGNTVVGIFPSKVVVDEIRGRAYSVSAQSPLGDRGGSGILAWLDLESHAVTQIDAGTTSVDLELDPVSGRVYTGGRFYTPDPNDPTKYKVVSGLITVEPDGRTDATLLAGSSPLEIVLDPGDRVYMLSEDELGSDEMSLLKTDGTILCLERSLNPRLAAMEISRQHDAAFVSSLENNSLILFREDTCPTNSLPLQVTTGREPRAVLVDDASDRVYVANRGDGTLTVYQLTGLTSEEGNRLPLATVDLRAPGQRAPHPIAMALDPEKMRLHIAHEQETYVTSVDTETLEVAGIVEGVVRPPAAGSIATVEVLDLVVERGAEPRRLQVIYNESLDFFGSQTQGWLATVELEAPVRVTHRQVGGRLSDMAVDERRGLVVIADLETGSLFLLPADPPITASAGTGAALLGLGLLAAAAARRRAGRPRRRAMRAERSSASGLHPRAATPRSLTPDP